MSDIIERVPLLGPLTNQELTVAMLIAQGLNYQVCAELLHCRWGTVKSHAREVAAVIPGDLPCLTKVMVWARGAPLEVLTGERLRRLPPAEAWRGGVVVSSPATSTRDSR